MSANDDTDVLVQNEITDLVLDGSSTYRAIGFAPFFLCLPSMDAFFAKRVPASDGSGEYEHFAADGTLEIGLDHVLEITQDI